jgi:hypothetical protein
MNTEKDPSTSTPLAGHNLPSTLAPDSARQIATLVREVAERAQGDPIALLHLLRAVEQVHREIQEDYFQSALPDSRQALYALLRDIEENGGWPYIQRWKLQALFVNLSELKE